MIELVFLTCLASAPTDCRDRSLLFPEESGLMACMVRGQSHIADWIGAHPKEVVQNWRCRQHHTKEMQI